MVYSTLFSSKHHDASSRSLAVGASIPPFDDPGSGSFQLNFFHQNIWDCCIWTKHNFSKSSSCSRYIRRDSMCHHTTRCRRWILAELNRGGLVGIIFSELLSSGSRVNVVGPDGWLESAVASNGGRGCDFRRLENRIHCRRCHSTLMLTLTS